MRTWANYTNWGLLPFIVLELVEIQTVLAECLVWGLALHGIRELPELRIALVHLVEDDVGRTGFPDLAQLIEDGIAFRLRVVLEQYVSH